MEQKITLQNLHFQTLRMEMVQKQIIARGIKNRRVLKSMKKIPRDLFFDNNNVERAYKDSAFPIGLEQTISQPYIVALMTEALELKGHEKILEIGTGSGYQTAILADLSSEIFSIERIAPLAKNAKEKLKKSGFKNITIILSNGYSGFKPESPFDAIIVTAAAPHIPSDLLDQLKTGGRLVIPVGDGKVQKLLKIEKQQDKLITTNLTNCVFVPLINSI